MGRWRRETRQPKEAKTKKGVFARSIDSEVDRHANTVKKGTHAILGQKSIFRPGQAQPASDPEFY